MTALQYDQDLYFHKYEDKWRKIKPFAELK